MRRLMQLMGAVLASVALMATVSGAGSPGSGQARAAVGVAAGRLVFTFVYAFAHESGPLYDPSSAIVVAGSDGTGARVLTNPESDADTPSWSPDGAKIAYSQAPYGIWMMSADGTGTRHICGDGREGAPWEWCDEYPAWSPDGARIAYAYLMYGAGGLGVMVSNGSHRKLLLRSPSQGHSPSHLDWSPDGRWIAFDATPTAHGELYVVKQDGSGLRRVTRKDVYYPRWSPDGRRLLVIGGHEFGYSNDIYVIDVGTGKTTRVLKKPDVSSVSWAANGNRIAYTTPSDGLHIFDLTTKRDTRLKLRPSPCAVLDCTNGWSIYAVDWQWPPSK
jgi:Tol biopolymer transport system component